MKIIKSGSDKVNFVDINNVFVGYDLSQDCCEYAGWYLSKKECSNTQENEISDDEILPYTFDTQYFCEVKDVYYFDDGGMVRFKLIAYGLPDIYLHLFNSHNGYYSHGFESKIGANDWENGSL